MNRSNIVFGVLLIMLLGLGTSFATRSRSEHAAPSSSASSSSAPTKPAPHSSAPPKPSTAASITAPSAPPKAASKPKVLLDRPLAVIAADWALAAPGVLQNDGLEPNKKAAFSKAGLSVRLSASEKPKDFENALARGGADAAGADVAILPLPEFAAAYEALKALDPVMFLITGWSSGRDVLLSRFDRLDKLPPTGPVSLRGTPGTSAMFLTAFVLDTAGGGLDRLEFEASDATRRKRRCGRSRAKNSAASRRLTTAPSCFPPARRCSSFPTLRSRSVRSSNGTPRPWSAFLACGSTARFEWRATQRRPRAVSRNSPKAQNRSSSWRNWAKSARAV